MGSRPKTNYATGWALLKPISTKKFRNRVNFNRQQKSFITRTLNKLKKEGLLDIKPGRAGLEYELLYKYRKNRSENISGIKGGFLRGIAKTAKTRGNKIIGEHFDIIFIETDFEHLEDTFESDLEYSEILDIVREVLAEAIAPHYYDLKTADYFTILSANGWEIGRGRQKIRENKKGREYARGATKKVKVDELARFISRMLIKANEKYRIGLSLISGLNLYKFKGRRR